MNTKGKIPGVCSRKEGTRSPPAILPMRSLGLNSFTLKWKGHKHRAQNLPSTHTSRLKQLRGGPYWARESGRRHFNRIGAQGLLVSRESPGEGRRCHHHLVLGAKPARCPTQFSSQVGPGRRTVPNPPPVRRAQSPCPLSGAASCCSPSRGPGGTCSQGLGAWGSRWSLGGEQSCQGRDFCLPYLRPLLLEQPVLGKRDLPSSTAL